MDHDQEAAQHAGMQHDIQNDSEHDCCDKGDSDRERDCNNSIDCNHCTAGAVAIIAMSGKFLHWNRTYQSGLAEDGLAPSHSSPPFRPPIS